MGPLVAAHQWVNMTDVTVQLNSTHTVSITESCDDDPEVKLWSDLMTCRKFNFFLFVFTLYFCVVLKLSPLGKNV